MVEDDICVSNFAHVDNIPLDFLLGNNMICQNRKQKIALKDVVYLIDNI